MTRNQISRETLDHIRGFTAEVIGRYISLKTSGTSLNGLCPFHDDRNPSFSVKDTYFRCFGCGITGDVFKFVMLAENVTFLESVRVAAEIAGVDVKCETPIAAAKIEHERFLMSALADWRKKTLRAVAGDLRKRDERIRTARASFDAGIIDQNSLFDVLGVAYGGYSSLEYWYEQLVRDDLYSDQELWLMAEGGPYEEA